MEDEVEGLDTRVTIGLHPYNVKKLSDGDGSPLYDDETAGILGPVETAFSAAYEGLRSVHDVSEASKRNPTWTPAAALIHTDDLAQKKLTGILKGFDSVRANLEKGIVHLEGELSQPITAKAALSVAQEIRAHVKALDTSERMTFLQDAIDEGDEVTVSSLLGAPGYLSKIPADLQKTYLRLWHERTNPKMAKRLRAMKGAVDMVDRRAGLVFSEMEKAVGFIEERQEVRHGSGTVQMAGRRIYAKELRDARNGVEKLFADRGA